jgi:hypothetical protein
MHSVTFVSTHQRRTDFGCTITLPAQKLKQPPPAPTVSEPPFVARQVQNRGFGLCHVFQSRLVGHLSCTHHVQYAVSVMYLCRLLGSLGVQCTLYDSIMYRLTYPLSPFTHVVWHSLIPQVAIRSPSLTPLNARGHALATVVGGITAAAAESASREPQVQTRILSHIHSRSLSQILSDSGELEVIAVAADGVKS